MYFQLETINWQLSLQIAQKSKSKQKKPCATFELGIKDNQKQVHYGAIGEYVETHSKYIIGVEA